MLLVVWFDEYEEGCEKGLDVGWVFTWNASSCTLDDEDWRCRNGA